MVFYQRKELIWYGVDEKDAISVSEEDQEVIVPSSNIPLSEDQLDYLHSLVPTNLTRIGVNESLNMLSFWVLLMRCFKFGFEEGQGT